MSFKKWTLIAGLPGLALISIVVAAFQNPPQQSTGGQEIPASAPIDYVPIRMRTDLFSRDVTVPCAVTGQTVFVFPPFAIRSLQLENGSQTKPAILGGRFNFSQADADITLRIGIADLMRDSQYRQDIESAVKVRLGAQLTTQPYLYDDWLVQLVIRDVPLSSAPFRRTTSLRGEALMRLPVDAIARLRDADPSEVFLRIVGSYKAKVIAESFQINFSYAQSALGTIATRLTSTPDSKFPEALVALGGQVDYQRESLSRIMGVLDVEILQSLGAQYDQELLRRVLETALSIAVERIRLSQEHADRTIGVLLSNQLQITASKSKLTELVQYFKTDSESRIRSVLEQLSASQHGARVDVAGGINFGAIGGSASYATQYSNRSQNEKKAIEERFQRDIEELDKRLKGEIDIVNGIRFSESGDASALSSTVGRFTFGVFEYSPRRIRLDIPMTEPTLGELSSLQGLPVGSISAFGGQVESIPDGWKLCNGELLKRNEYTELFKAIGTTWGVGDGRDTFSIPNLQNWFLRGAWGNQRRVGTSQNPGTGRPAAGGESRYTSSAGGHGHTFTVHNLSNGGDGNKPPATGGGNRYQASTSGVGDHDHRISISWDEETRPVNMAVHFIIKVGARRQ